MQRARLVLTAAALATLFAVRPADATPGHTLFIASGIPSEPQVTIDLETLEQGQLAVKLNRAESLACGPDGLLYAGLSGYAGSGVRQIVRFDQDGHGFTTVIDFAETPALEKSGGPEGLSFGPGGELYFNTRANSAELPHTGVWRLPAQGGLPVRVMLPFTIQNAEATAFLIAGPYEGHLIAADYANARIVRIAPPFDVPQTALDFIADVEDVNGLAVNSKGEIYAAKELVGIITKFAPDGAPLGEVASTEYCIRKLTMDASDNLYATTVEGPVLRVTPDGALTVVGDVPEGNGLDVCEVACAGCADGHGGASSGASEEALPDDGGCACRLDRGGTIQRGRAAALSALAMACVFVRRRPRRSADHMR